MPAVSGLRSSYARVGRLVYFGRMLDKIRLHSKGALPSDYHANLGGGFDARCCMFLRVGYSDIVAQVKQGASDEAVLSWCEARGVAHTDDECNIWNRFMMKIGWRDDRTAVLKQRIVEYGLNGRQIETFFDLNDIDEGRDPVAIQAWLN
jgi:gluconokinase